MINIKPNFGLVGVRQWSGGPGLNPRSCHTKDFKNFTIPPWLTLSNKKVPIKSKVEQFREGVVPSSIPRCSSYWKGSFLVAIDYGRLYFLLELNSNTWNYLTMYKHMMNIRKIYNC